MSILNTTDKNDKLFTKPENNVEEKKESSRDIFLKWVDTFTMHAIPNIFRTRHLLLKVLWMIAFLTSSGFCAYVVYQSIANYLQYNVVTKITVTKENPIIFPTVTICNLNPFVTEYSFQLVQDFVKNEFSLDVNDMLNGTPSYSILDSIKYPLKKRYMEYGYLVQQLATNLTDERKKYLGFTIDKFLISCFFGPTPCDESDFTWTYDFLYGNCFRFNSGKGAGESKNDIKKSKIGFVNGLKLELFLGDSSNPRSLALSSGAHIFIHNNSIIPDTFEGINVNAGTTTNIVLHKSYVTKLADPYSDCTDNLDDSDSFDSDLYRHILKSKSSYRQKDCFDLCYQKKLLEICGCYDAGVSRLNPTDQPCFYKNQTLCQYQVFTSYFNNGFQELCSKQCPLECYSTTYSYSLGTSLLPTLAYAHNLRKDPSLLSRFNNKTDLDIFTLRESVLSLNVYYDSFEVTNIEENAQMQSADLVAGVGGTLGLFLGISLLSLFEFVEITLEIVLSKARYSKKAKNYD